MSTNIEWTDATWNPVTGCTKVSQGCKHCYAERLFPKVYPGRAFTDVRFHRDRIDAPLSWRRPRRIFVNSMSDLFHESVTWETLDILFAVMALCQGRHTFQILTKRPRRMRDYFGERPNSPATGLRNRIARRFAELARNDDVTGFALPLPNVWLGVSVEDQATADERIPLLLQTPAAVRFLSCEPLLGPIDLTSTAATQVRKEALAAGVVLPTIDWVIAGGESGPKARPSHPDWFRLLRDQCAGAGTAFFFKQWGEWWEAGSDLRDEDGGHVVVDAIGTHAGEWFEHGDRLIAPDGRTFDNPAAIPDDVPCRLMTRLGKKAAGRELDGRVHDEYPA